VFEASEHPACPVVVAGLASVRRGTHSTKTRGEVSGGGRKPWRQKGTGRARQGSNRAPQWAGGGIVHGPRPRDHDMRVNKKMKRGALRSALTDALVSGKLAVVQDLEFDEPKTKSAAAVLDTLELGGKVRSCPHRVTRRGRAVVPEHPNRVAYASPCLRGDRGRPPGPHRRRADVVEALAGRAR
jgi:50S ribosomal protein L4